LDSKALKFMLFNPIAKYKHNGRLKLIVLLNKVILLQEKNASAWSLVMLFSHNQKQEIQEKD
jgi:hypothetical protein